MKGCTKYKLYAYYVEGHIMFSVWPSSFQFYGLFSFEFLNLASSLPYMCNTMHIGNIIYKKTRIPKKGDESKLLKVVFIIDHTNNIL